jgi:hypothetical protein
LSDPCLTLEPLTFILGLVLGYLCCRWDVPHSVFDTVDNRLYPIAVFLGVVPYYELVVQLYVYPLLGSGHRIFSSTFQGKCL